MATADDTVPVNSYSHTARKCLLVNASGTPVAESNWRYQKATTGNVGSEITVTPTSGDKILTQLVVNAPLASDSATINVYVNSTTSTNAVFEGWMANRDQNGAIMFPGGAQCTSSWIVEVTGGSGTVYILAKYT